MSISRSFFRRQRLHLAKEARRAARKVRFPKDFEGVVMWCPKCYAELRRIPDGETLAADEQQRIADEHRVVCKASN